MPIQPTGLSSTELHSTSESTQTNGARSEPTNLQKETGNKAASETVTLTETAKNLHQLEKSVIAQPTIDTQRIENVKQAIEQGNYDFNPIRTAEKFLQFESQLKR